MSKSNVSNLTPPYKAESESLRRNSEQWKAFESQENCVILAGPGSGKTKVLTIKLARMLDEDVRPPRGIACITYSKECVRELQRRLLKLGIEDGRSAVISTVHAFCLHQVILPFAKLAGEPVPEPLTVALEPDQKRFFEEAVESVVYEDPARMRTRCEAYRRTQIDRSQPEWRNGDREAALIIEKYEQLLDQNGLIDFDGMMLKGLRLIEKNAWVRKALRARFPILVVDEYQDLGVPLHRIVLSLCFEAGIRLVAVGDPDQSIYGFTGARPKLLTELAGMTGVEVVRLKMNYRCGPQIIKASEIALGGTRGFQSASSEQGMLDVHQCPKGMEEQAHLICEEIIPAILERRAGRKRGDIAVLYRDKNDGEVIASEAERQKWPFIRIDQGNPYPRSPLIFWLQDCANWCSGGWRKGEPRLSAIIRSWWGFNRSLAEDSARRSSQMSLVGFLQRHRTPEAYLRAWLDAFLSECLSKPLENEPTLLVDKDAVSSLTSACAEGAKLADLTTAAFGGEGGTGEHLRLMTLHSAKGLEFDAVIIMGMEQGRTPSFQAIKERRGGSTTRLLEDRRLFYVGLTRARHEVHFTTSGWYKNRFGVFRDGTSEFVLEVMKSLIKPS